MAFTDLTVNNRTLLALHTGLSNLDGVKTADGVVPFVFKRDVKWRLTLAAVAVERAKEPFERELRRLRDEHGITEYMTQTPENAARLAAYQKDFEALLDQTVKFPDLETFTFDDLIDVPPDKDKRDVGRINPIPLSVLKNLHPILI